MAMCTHPPQPHWGNTLKKCTTHQQKPSQTTNQPKHHPEHLRPTALTTPVSNNSIIVIEEDNSIKAVLPNIKIHPARPTLLPNNQMPHTIPIESGDVYPTHNIS